MSYGGRRRLAAGALVAFVVIVATQTLLAPSYDPAKQEISEYVHTSAGWLMVIGFLAWSFSWALLATLPPTTEGVQSRTVVLQRAAFCGAALGLALAACFATDRGAIEPGVVAHATTAGRVHDAAAALVTLSVVVAALTGATLRGPRVKAAGLLLLGAGLASDVALLATGDPLPGVRQRTLVAAACLWQALWLASLDQ